MFWVSSCKKCTGIEKQKVSHTNDEPEPYSFGFVTNFDYKKCEKISGLSHRIENL